MKINDIFKEAIDIYEVFNTNVKIDWKEETESIHRGYFEINDTQYRINFEAGIFRDVNFLNLSFEILVDDKWSIEFQGDRKDASKVIGAIMNGIRQKIKEYNIDVIVFFAADNVDKRMKLYNYLARRYMDLENFGSIRDNYELPNGKLCTVVLKRDNMKGLTIDELIAHVESLK